MVPISGLPEIGGAVTHRPSRPFAIQPVGYGAPTCGPCA